MLKFLGPIVATAIVVLFLLVSAVPLMHWFEAEGRAAALKENRALWERLGIADYRFTVTADCDCGVLSGRTLDVTVREGNVAGLADTATGERFPSSAAGPSSVPALFERIAAAIDSRPDEIIVSYDDNYGFPREIRVDPDNRVAGDEWKIAVTRFDPRTKTPALR